MSNRKPKIFASCKAGCNWETIHRSEFETAYPYVPVYLNQDGVLNVERNIRYKIYNKNAYTSTYGFKIKINASGTIITLSNPEFDKYKNYVFFKFLDFVPNYLGMGTAMIYELNDERGVKFMEGNVGLVSYNVTFDSTTGVVSGNGTDKFTYTKVEKPSSELLKQVTLEVEGDSVVLRGDTEFVEDYDYTTGLEEGTDKIISVNFISITWKTTYTPTANDEYVNTAHTIVSGSQTNNSRTATARYTIPAHYEITDYSWVETYDDYVLSSTSVNGSTYTANYCVFSVYVEDLERALICNDDVTFMVEYIHDDPVPIVTIYSQLPSSGDLATLHFSLSESQKAEILKDVEHTILKLTGSSRRTIYFYYTGSKFGSYYYTTTIDSKTYTMTIANTSTGRITATILEVSGGTGGDTGGITIYTPVRE